MHQHLVISNTYMIKDHWVKNPSHETEMIKAMSGIPGVPTLVDYWEVEVSSDIPDITSRYWVVSCTELVQCSEHG